MFFSQKEKLEIEFVKFILAHAKIREDLESGELVKIGLFKKGVCTDTTAKEKMYFLPLSSTCFIL